MTGTKRQSRRNGKERKGTTLTECMRKLSKTISPMTFSCRTEALTATSNEIVDLMLETVCTRRKTIRIAGDDYPAELVKAKFMKLDSEHIRFVLDCMRENTTKIRNIKQYLRAVLFNAPSTIGNYYTSLVAHDMASGALAPRKPKFGDPDYYSCNEGESL